MAELRKSIAPAVIGALVVATTLVLGAFAFFSYRTEKIAQGEQLRLKNAALAEQLAVSLALPVWNFDRGQIDKILEGALLDEDVAGVAVKLVDANSTVQVRARDQNWKVQAFAREPASTGLLLETRSITNRADLLGTVKVFMTPRFMEAGLAGKRATLILDILVVEALLMLVLAQLLWHLVLKPIKILEQHAALVSQGDGESRALEESRFRGELESLRASLDKMLHLLKARYQAVQASEERFQLAVRGSADGIWDWNLLTHEAFYSDRFRELLGYTQAEFPDFHASFESVLHPDDVDRILKSVAAHLKERRTHDDEFRLRTKAGEYRWFRGRGQAVWNPEGRPVRMAGSITDITEQKEAALSLVHSEQRFSRMFNSSPVPILLFRLADGVILDANECFFRMSGFAAEEVVGRTSLELNVYPDPSQRAFIMEQLRLHGHLHGHEQLFQTKSGQILNNVLWFDVVSINGEQCVLVIALDITAAKLSEQLIRESEEKFSKAFLSSPNGIAITELATGRYIEVNESFCQIYGYAKHEMIGRTSLELGVFKTPEEREKVIGPLRTTGRVKDYEMRMRTPRGEAKTLLVSAERMEIGGKLCMVLVIFDVTARLEAEAGLAKTSRQLRALTSRLQSLREEERTHLAREIHDHLGQLLTALSLDLRLIERRAARVSDQELLAALNLKISSARALADETITSVQKIATGLRPAILDRVGLGAAIEAEVKAFQQRTGMDCQLSMPEGAVKATADQATAMFRIFQELLTNVARHARASQLSVCLRQEDGSLQLAVTDNGVGIREHALEDPDSIGLLGMRERAQILGGTLAFDRPAGPGTVATVSIPIRAEAAPAA